MFARNPLVSPHAIGVRPSSPCPVRTPLGGPGALDRSPTPPHAPSPRCHGHRAAACPDMQPCLLRAVGRPWPGRSLSLLHLRLLHRNQATWSRMPPNASHGSARTAPSPAPTAWPSSVDRCSRSLWGVLTAFRALGGTAVNKGVEVGP